LRNLVLAFPIVVDTKQMSPLHILCNHPILQPEGCFESILARSWYTPGASSDADQGERLEWLSVILSDNNRVRAAAFHVAYAQSCSQIMDDEAARMALEHQYNRMQRSVTPICYLPAEIFRQIFSIALDIGQSRTRLMHVCRHWRAILEGMPNAWTSLKLQAWTPPESVQRSLDRADIQPLVIEIDVEKTEIMTEGHDSALAIAARSASRWETLTITSLPQSEQEVQYVRGLLSMHLPPVNRLRHLRVIQSVSSPLLTPLIHNVAAAAEGSLAAMEIDSSPAILILSQPAHASLFGSLTTFKAHLPKMSESVDLLPHFNRLEVLELTNLLLPLYASHNLPFCHTLHHLYLRAVSIQWMGGQVFPQLESCTLIAAPMRTHPLLLDVILPACTTFHIENKDIAAIRRFQVPNMVVRSRQWSPGRGNEQISHLIRAVCERPLQPHVLHLAILCTGTVVLSLLELLPSLKELRLDLARPAQLGRQFFTALLAKPFGKIDWTQPKPLKKAKGWTSMVCPSLSVLELRYQQWLRQSDCVDWLAPLLALSWSRERTATPLKLELHFRQSQDSWRSFELKPQLSMPMSMLAVPSLAQYDQSPPFDLLHHYYTSAILHSIYKTFDINWSQSILGITLYEAHVFPFCFDHLQVLDLKSGRTQLLNVLPSFQQLKNLSLSNIQIPPLSIEGELPLVHTLRKLSLRQSTLAWMDGKVFAQVERFHVDEHGWPGSFKQNVQMPICTHVQLYQDNLKVLPLLHSDFYLPSLNKWELSQWFDKFPYDEQGIWRLQRIQAKTFKFAIRRNCQMLMDILEANHEVQQLELTIRSFSSQQLLTRLSVINGDTKKVPCPNMKVLHLQFLFGEQGNMGQVSQWCRQMVDERRLAGYPIEKCCIWWDVDDWEQPASLVLVTRSGEVRTEG
jgi:hypothetical protein